LGHKKGDVHKGFLEADSGSWGNNAVVSPINKNIMSNEKEGEENGGDVEDLGEGEEEVVLEAEGNTEGNKNKEENIFRRRIRRRSLRSQESIEEIGRCRRYWIRGGLPRRWFVLITWDFMWITEIGVQYALKPGEGIYNIGQTLIKKGVMVSTM
jgi:hypothetical protein